MKWRGEKRIQEGSEEGNMEDKEKEEYET